MVPDHQACHDGHGDDHDVQQHASQAESPARYVGAWLPLCAPAGILYDLVARGDGNSLHVVPLSWFYFSW
jgi:hypothetical protein